MSNATDPQFVAAVAAFKVWDVAIDTYLVDATEENSKTEQTASDNFQVAFTSLCNARGVHRIAKACHLAERHLWDQVQVAAQQVTA